MAPSRLPLIHIIILHNDLPRLRKLLHRKKTSVDLQDHRGATPLMLAAMIGSPELVTLLLERKASWHIADKSASLASDYVEGPFADRVRSLYQPFTRRQYSGSARQKEHIQKHLANTSALKTQYRTKSTGTLVFQRHGSMLKISKLIAKVDVARPISQNTTAACIAPGTTVKPQMCAVSGWKALGSSRVLDGSKYTQVVRNMARILDFDLTKHCYDTPGGGFSEQNIGRFNAVSQQDFYLIPCI
jgi:hypothetical protein